MYRVIVFGTGSVIAVEMGTSGRSMDDELEEIETFVMEGQDVILTDDYEQHGAELIEREYL
ncbi:hypothetical protein KAU11_08935 [Candidatus Babeliales bacterium]|nr:hypothetical protein [Candidatus Babeliales bacterium]